MPTHATVAPNGYPLFVASAGSLSPNGTDSVALLSPASSFGGGLFLADTVSLPAGPCPLFSPAPRWLSLCGELCDEPVNAINTSTNQAGNPTPVATNPVAMAELRTPPKLYVANQGSDSAPA